MDYFAQLLCFICPTPRGRPAGPSAWRAPLGLLALLLALHVGSARADADTLYVAEYNPNRVTQIAPDGTKTPFISGGLNGPNGLAFDASRNLFVTQDNTNIISEYSPAGTFITSFSSNGGQPYLPAFDVSGNLFVPDFDSNKIEKFSPTNTDLGTFATTPARPHRRCLRRVRQPVCELILQQHHREILVDGHGSGRVRLRPEWARRPGL